MFTPLESLRVKAMREPSGDQAGRESCPFVVSARSPVPSSFITQRSCGPIRSLADLEEITSAWVHWYNTGRLMHRLGRRPPAEAEAGYYEQAEDAA